MYKAEDILFAPLFCLLFIYFSLLSKHQWSPPEGWKVWIGRLLFKEKRFDSAFPMFVYCSRNSRIASPQIMVWRLSHEFLALSYACPLALITYFNWFPFDYVLLQDFLPSFHSVCSTFPASSRSVCLVAGLPLSSWPWASPSFSLLSSSYLLSMPTSPAYPSTA